MNKTEFAFEMATSSLRFGAGVTAEMSGWTFETSGLPGCKGSDRQKPGRASTGGDRL